MKYYFIILLFLIFCFSCKQNIEKNKNINSAVIIANNDSLIKKDTISKKQKKVLQTTNNFKDVLQSIKNVKCTDNKHSDELTNRSSNFVNEIFSLDETDLTVKTTSYEYKKNCVFYLHTIKHVNNNISIKPYLEKAQGKTTIGYLGERVFLFAMKNDIEANFIDIPEKLNPIELREELLEILYKKINSDVILCYRTKDCIYKDLRKNKKILQTTYSFQKLLSTVKDIEHTGNKHKDWMFNRARTLDSIFLLNNREYKVKTTSYEYKKNCVFYLHTIKHIDNNISIKPYLENAQGRTTRGYTTERVLLFAMKNDIEANFIDIPEKLNPIELREELLEILYKKVNSDIILCYRTKNCIYKDLRKNK